MKTTKKSSLQSILGKPTGPAPISLFAKAPAKPAAKAKTFSLYGAVNTGRPNPSR
jgi:hypothetical protein